MALLTQAPKGTQDLFPPQSGRWQVVEDVMRSEAAIHGFGEVRTPVFEHTELFLRSVGDTTDVVEKQIKEMLTRYRAEIRKASDEAKKSGQDMANGLKTADTQIKALLTTTQKLNADGSITETRKGYDELGRSITEVYKAGQLLNRSVSSESALSSDIRRANDLYKEQLASIKKIYDLKTKRLTVNDGTAMAVDIDKQIADVQQ